MPRGSRIGWNAQGGSEWSRLRWGGKTAGSLTPHCAPPLAASGGLAEELLQSRGSPDSHPIPEAPRPLKLRNRALEVVVIGVVQPEAYPGTRVSAEYGYTHVPGRRVPASRTPAGPYALLTVKGTCQPRLRVRRAWKLGPRCAGWVCRLGVWE